MKQRIDPTDIAALDRKREEDEKRRKLDRDQDKADFAWLVSDRRGRRFMWRLFERTGVFRNPFTGSSETFFKCGEMNIGQRYLADLTEFAPEAYLTMLQEQKSK